MMKPAKQWVEEMPNVPAALKAKAIAVVCAIQADVLETAADMLDDLAGRMPIVGFETARMFELADTFRKLKP